MKLLRRLCFLWLALAACGGEVKSRTQVMLQIDADAPVREALRSLRITAHTSDDEGQHWARAFSDALTEPAQAGFAWPARLALVPEPSHPKRRFALNIAALAQDGSVLVGQSVVSQFVEGKTKLLQVQLEQACVEHASCANDECVGSNCQTCREGQCVDVGLRESLPDFVPSGLDAGAAADGGGPDARVPGPDGGPADGGVDSGSSGAGRGGANAGVDGSSHGEAGAGQGGTSAGAGGDQNPATGFRVESAAPAADSDAVEPDVTIEIRFSDELDPTTLDETSFAVRRGAHAVPGTFEVVGRKVAFKPQATLALAATYTVELASELRDRSGRALQPLQLSFRVRDGVWSTQRLNAAESTCDPYVAVAGNGFATVVYSVLGEVGDAGSDAVRVWARRFPAGASAWGAPEQVGMNSGRGGFRCRVTVNNRGYAVAAWDYADGVLQSGFTTGPTWSAEAWLDNSAYGPQVVLTETARAYAVLQLVHRATTIHSYTFTAGESGWSALSLSEASFGSAPQIALLDAAAMAVWQQDTMGDAGAPGTRIWAAGMGQLGCSGAGWACPKLISGRSDSAAAPQLASDRAHTTVVAVWQQADATWSHIWASRLTAGGNWSEPVRVSDDTGSATEPVIAVDRVGRARALWQQTVGGSSRIVSAVWSPGEAWSAPVYVSQPSSEQCRAPALAVEPGGSALVAWNQVAGDQESDLWVGRFVEGQGFQSSLRKSLSSAHSAARPSLGIDDAGRGFVTWLEDAGAWAARFQ